MSSAVPRPGVIYCPPDQRRTPAPEATDRREFTRVAARPVRAGHRGLARAGLIVSILLPAVSALTIALAVSSPAFRAAYESARASASSAAADAPAAGAPAGGVAAGSAGPGVKAACRTIVPARMNLEADLQGVRTPAQYGRALATLESTMSTAADGAADPRFQQDVARLDADLEKASAAVRRGQDPSSLASALDADGEAVGEACASAGFTN